MSFADADLRILKDQYTSELSQQPSQQQLYLQQQQPPQQPRLCQYAFKVREGAWW